jgi:hypothetical protein
VATGRKEAAMRHLSLVKDNPTTADFPPGWAEFEAARRRFFAGLEAQAAPSDHASPETEPPGEGAAS